MRQWLRGQIVLIGGTWHAFPHGGEFADAHNTPVGPLLGVVTHANYVQSLLWGAMFPARNRWRIVIEVLLAGRIAIIFLLTRGVKRFALIIITILTVVIATWVFSAALGMFFDLVLPDTFLGVHAMTEELGENVRVVSEARLRAILVVGVMLLSATLMVRERQRIESTNS